MQPVVLVSVSAVQLLCTPRGPCTIVRVERARAPQFFNFDFSVQQDCRFVSHTSTFTQQLPPRNYSASTRRKTSRSSNFVSPTYLHTCKIRQQHFRVRVTPLIHDPLNRKYFVVNFQAPGFFFFELVRRPTDGPAVSNPPTAVACNTAHHRHPRCN